MKPISFKYSNRMLQPGSAKYSQNINGVEPLPIWTNGEQCVSCWKMSWRERFNALVYGKVWIALLSGSTQPPMFAEAAKEYLTKKDE